MLDQGHKGGLSQNLFPIAFSRNAVGSMKKWDTSTCRGSILLPLTDGTTAQALVSLAQHGRQIVSDSRHVRQLACLVIRQAKRSFVPVLCHDSRWIDLVVPLRQHGLATLSTTAAHPDELLKRAYDVGIRHVRPFAQRIIRIYIAGAHFPRQLCHSGGRIPTRSPSSRMTVGLCTRAHSVTCAQASAQCPARRRCT